MAVSGDVAAQEIVVEIMVVELDFETGHQNAAAILDSCRLGSLIRKAGHRNGPGCPFHCYCTFFFRIPSHPSLYLILKINYREKGDCGIVLFLI